MLIAVPWHFGNMGTGDVWLNERPEGIPHPPSLHREPKVKYFWADLITDPPDAPVRSGLGIPVSVHRELGVGRGTNNFYVKTN